ncbi:MAG: dihydrodipicolinate synthase family protein [Stappiaceae bacterium]
MSAAGPRFGLSAALATPFAANGDIQSKKLIEHAQWCLDSGCDSVTLFGTTGEGASISDVERKEMLHFFEKHGVSGKKLVAGITATSVEEAVNQARLAYDLSCRAVLMLPPFYFKGVDEEGIYRWYCEVIDRLGDQARDVLLYNIPSQSGIEITPQLVGRLRSQYGAVIAGVKDSSCHWPTSCAFLETHSDIAILIGDERHLAAAVRKGGQGAICGLANLYPGLIRPMAHQGEDSHTISALVEALVHYPVIPAIKSQMAAQFADTEWSRTRPPLQELPNADAARLAEACANLARTPASQGL